MKTTLFYAQLTTWVWPTDIIEDLAGIPGLVVKAMPPSYQIKEPVSWAKTKHEMIAHMDLVPAVAKSYHGLITSSGL